VVASARALMSNAPIGKRFGIVLIQDADLWSQVLSLCGSHKEVNLIARPGGLVA
jgi:hypothetical protein